MRLKAIQPNLGRITGLIWIVLAVLLAAFAWGGVFYAMPCLLIALWLILRPLGWFATKVSVVFSVLLAVIFVASLASDLAWSDGDHLVPISIVLASVAIALVVLSLLAAVAAWRHDASLGQSTEVRPAELSR